MRRGMRSGLIGGRGWRSRSRSRPECVPNAGEGAASPASGTMESETPMEVRTPSVRDVMGQGWCGRSRPARLRGVGLQLLGRALHVGGVGQEVLQVLPLARALRAAERARRLVRHVEPEV